MILLITCIAGVIHLLLTMMIARAFLKKRNKNRSTGNQKLSIIIAARNEYENLKKLIPKLLEQSHANFEIIVGLDHCSDQSAAYLSSFDSTKVKFQDIQETPYLWNSKKYALSKAIDLSTGEWLVFTDADCLPASNNWLLHLSAEITSNTDIIIGTSPYQNENSLLSNYISFEAFMTAFLYISKALRGRPYMAVGRNMAIRKSFFQKVEGYESFKSSTGGDDDLFIQKHASKSNTAILIGPASLIYTFPKQSWKEYFAQKRRHLSIGQEYHLSDKLHLSLFHLSHLLFLLLLPFNSIRIFAALLLFYLFIKLVGYRFAASKMGFSINYMFIPLVDMLYAMLTPVIALWSKLEKDTTWKN